MSTSESYSKNLPIESVLIENVHAAIGDLFASTQFEKSKRCQTLLSFLVNETLAGRGDLLKERIVGAAVF